MLTHYRNFLIRDWQPADRSFAAAVIQSVLTEYGLVSDELAQEPGGADWDVLNVEAAYWQTGGAFWVVEEQQQIVGTAGFYPIARQQQAVEIRKMYLLPSARRQGLGQFLLQSLEQTIAAQGFSEIWIETASVLQAAVRLYERNGYQPIAEVTTARCDRAYMKRLSHSGPKN